MSRIQSPRHSSAPYCDIIDVNVIQTAARVASKLESDNQAIKQELQATKEELQTTKQLMQYLMQGLHERDLHLHETRCRLAGAEAELKRERLRPAM
jgi:hypothetical protein